MVGAAPTGAAYTPTPASGKPNSGVRRSCAVRLGDDSGETSCRAPRRTDRTTPRSSLSSNSRRNPEPPPNRQLSMARSPFIGLHATTPPWRWQPGSRQTDEVKPDRVAVLGCGPAGAATAITLAARGISVVAIDPRPAGQWEPGEGLPAAANAALRKLGLWPSFQAGGHLPASGFQSCWGSAEPAFRPALLDPRGPSWQLDRVRFNQMLRDAVDSLLSSRVTEVRRDGPQWILTLSDQLPMSVDFIVDATGRSGRLRRAPRRVDSRLVGITALLPDPSPGDAAGIVEAVPEGWWYASRIPGGRLTVALFTDASIASQADWSDLMAKTGFVGQRAGWPRVEQLRTVRAGSSTLEHLAGPGWLAV